MSGHRTIHWLWNSRRLPARVARAGLLPLAGLYRATMAIRELLYRLRVFRVRQLALPAVAVGNLSVGGAGKTPLAAWIAGYYSRRGLRPGVLLRGYGADEGPVHRRLVPDAIVVENPDRIAGGLEAAAGGAMVLVLDDAYQRLDVARDLNIVVVSAERARAVRWPLPAGPWREGFGALSRADVIVVTRRRVPANEAAALARLLGSRHGAIPVAVAHLGLSGLEGMRSGRPLSSAVLSGKRVVAAAGIADPSSFAVQVRASGARVQLVAYQDHHEYPDADLERLVRAARDEADYVVVTEKDAVKLRHRWPPDAPEPLVAVLTVTWETNGDLLTHALDRVALERNPSPTP
jgi:tetraacyldisaccharide 4'-kinase